MPEFMNALSLPSRVKYLAWRAMGRRFPVNLALPNGAKFQIRPNAMGRMGNNDYGVAYEIWVHKHLDLIRIYEPETVRTVVDIGGNVGLSCVHWLAKYPNCQVTVYEPHPGHLAQIRLNLKLNKATDRVIIREVAAGAAARTMELMDRGSASSLVFAKRANETMLPIVMVDLFNDLKGIGPIDIMKIDIEGGEYELLGDSRFGELPIRHLVMEWHRVPGETRDAAWCRDRLLAWGYGLGHSEDDKDGKFGIITASAPRRSDGSGRIRLAGTRQ